MLQEKINAIEMNVVDSCLHKNYNSIQPPILVVIQ